MKNKLAVVGGFVLLIAFFWLSGRKEAMAATRHVKASSNIREPKSISKPEFEVTIGPVEIIERVSN